MTEERIETLPRWHAGNAVTEYERHRNQAIFEARGNRNALIESLAGPTRSRSSTAFDSTGERIATSCDACERGKRLLSDHVHLQDVCDPLAIRAERIAQIEKDRADAFHAIPLIISRSYSDKFC
ncbi:hypothetical protein CBA19CS22_06260 [Caballeronia novacaledonica]|uniref:Uncharacterized protein n=1 Tax=Caballeronia novacaledonica TaxID=1544861 RepID=A0ACB5QLP1_9BURK|nr:hypothetical protein CBA19CS22_06260 [Caballeronia novacaledonica]